MMRVVVIGGGIVGSTAAYELARSGVQATLVDEAHTGQATAAGAGIISPGTTFNAPPPLQALFAAAASYYPELIARLADDGECETGYETVGSLVVATSANEADRLHEVVRFAEQRRSAGVKGIGDVRLIDGREAKALFPALADVPSAVHISSSSRIDGRSMRDALQHAASRRGAEIIRGEARLERDGDRVRSVVVGHERLEADAVFITAGAWSPSLAATLGIELPIYPQRGQILHLVLPNIDTANWPIVHGFHSHYLLTFPPNRVVAGATREDESGFDCRVTAAGLREVTGEALRIAPGLADATFVEMRVGLRPATPDGLPVLGLLPGTTNVYVSAGHGPSGLQLGPYSGALLVDLLHHQPPPLDLAPFSPSRFKFDSLHPA